MALQTHYHGDHASQMRFCYIPHLSSSHKYSTFESTLKTSSVYVLHTFPVIKPDVLSRGICLSCLNCILFDVQIVIRIDHEGILMSLMEGVVQWRSSY